MIERPITMDDASVLATLAGDKIELRRPMAIGQTGIATTGEVISTWFSIGRHRCIGLRDDGTWPSAILQHCPFGVTGDQLWVRECWAVGACANGFTTAELHARTWRRDNGGCWYRIGGANPRTPISSRGHWRQPNRMPRWASRIKLEITSARVEHVQDIDEAGARREGMRPFFERYSSISQDQRLNTGELCADSPYRASFACVWDETFGCKDRLLWIRNPWVWVIQYRRLP